MPTKPRLLRITTVPISLHLLLTGQFSFFEQQGFEVLTISADGPEVAQLKEQGIKHQAVALTRTITPFKDLICLLQLIRIIRKYRPDIVHTHTPKAGLLGMVAARLCGVRVRLHTVAGLPLMEATGLKKRLLKATEWITYFCANRVYPNSQGLLRYIQQEFGIDELKFKVIARGSTNGIDVNHFTRTLQLEKQAAEVRSKAGITLDAIAFSFVGRIVGDKGIAELVNAFKMIASDVNARLLLIGPFEPELDPLPAEIMEFIKNDSRIVIAGFQRDVRPWLLASDVFVFPSYREGFPNVVMQAACLEIPCIVSDINGCNELIENGVSGWLVPPKKDTLLAEAMKRMAEKKEERFSFALQAKSFVSENFGRQYVWDELFKEYKIMLG
jgi:glycosyltransferase involved in cell wall biosynthesis